MEIRDVRPTQPKPSSIPQTLSCNPPAHVSNKKFLNKAHGPIRQSELLSEVNTKNVVSEILNTEIPLTLWKLLKASKELSSDLQKCLRPQNKVVTALGYHSLVTESVSYTSSPPTKNNLIYLTVTHNGHPITAIIDTRSQLNVIKEEVAHRIGVPIDLSCLIIMNNANSGQGELRGNLC